jgi:hypothetical protein
MSLDVLTIVVYSIFDGTGGLAAFESYGTRGAMFFDKKEDAEKALSALISEFGKKRWEIIECNLLIPNKWGYVEK